MEEISEGQMKQEAENREIGIRQQNTGYLAFFFSGICSISSGIVVSLLQEQTGFAYGMTGTLLSLMSIGNLIAGFAAGLLCGKLGMKLTVALLTAGYMLGYSIMSVTGWIPLLAAAFFLTGLGKGSAINTCTILVGNNGKDRTKSMNLLHSCYAFGAFLCPFVIAWAATLSDKFPMIMLAVFGGIMWLSFVLVPMETVGEKGKKGTDWSFLKSRKFWLLTGLIFCQNAAEMNVNGWMVTYFKGSGILSGVMSAYTVTVMWGATLLARLLIAFVFPLKKPEKAMIRMGIGCTVFYVLMMGANSQIPAILLLFAFAASMAGMNPTAVAAAGRMTSVASMGVMLPTASAGAILMPWVTGFVADRLGLRAGMVCNIVPCIGMLLFSVAVKNMKDREES